MLSVPTILLAIGLLVMMYPILCRVRYESLHGLFAHRGLWKQLAFSIFVNWILAPFLMVLFPQFSRLWPSPRANLASSSV